MDPHDRFTRDHRIIREQAKLLQDAVSKNPENLGKSLQEFQALVRAHFQREDTYYRILDDGKRIADRGLVHQLRNDHAAAIFTLESLGIRYRKSGVNSEWMTRFTSLINVLLPHLDQEESVLFPLGRKLLTAEEVTAIQQDIAARE